ncbi:YqgE/AlgH family protein [Pedobacter sp. PLR]|uniref:YqgE/AlgH family protein n=1 Tax=Pedobacter sp. PLR TaxID=2994465 RepID=UPI0022458889|nr:YqgE/AlgH family protein [Pedobacter sp. PLR]MCX2449975.1 YqgE/AlgH family protein [Pedobacter sp. PLR]
MLSRLAPSAGKLLISEPFLMDPNFKRSVVFVTEHQDEGTVGFILNHKSALLLSDLVPDFTGGDFPVYLGGPVAVDTIHFIHRCSDLLTDGEEIAKGIYWGGNFEALKVLVNSHHITPENIKFFIGYSGWTGQQLEEEMKENTWIVSDQYDADLVFSNNEEELWKQVIINLGPKYAHISNFPQNPNLN